MEMYLLGVVIMYIVGCLLVVLTCSFFMRVSLLHIIYTQLIGDVRECTRDHERRMKED